MIAEVETYQLRDSKQEVEKYTGSNGLALAFSRLDNVANTRLLGWIDTASHRTLSNAARGLLMKKTPEEIVTILDELYEDANQWPSEIAERRRSTSVHQVDTNTFVQVQLDAMAKEIRMLTLASIHNEPHAACDICGRGHPTHECQATIEEVNHVANAWKQNNSRFQGAPGFVNQPRLQFQPQQSNQSGLEDLMESFIVKIDERLDAHGAAIKELRTADTDKNPKETVNVVTLRSEQVMKDSIPIHKEVALGKESGKELKIEYDKKTEKKKGKKGVEKKRRRKLQEVNVNLPFTELLSQMPAYAKFLKEILTKKRKIEDTKVFKLTEHWSAILQNKLPQKYGDPGSFTIPFSLGILNFDKSLCDCGASVNLMPLSIYRKREKEIGEIRSVPISLQLVDQAAITPEEIVEDVLLRVDKFVFPVDFIVVNMEENKEVPLILGRPFVAMGRDILDIHDRKLMLRVGEEMVTFEMNVAHGVKKEKPAANVEWTVKGVKEESLVIEKDK
ncbi:PREDICTED: uncharacterized protein LOC109243102 [Nicotiana attenuata]|uniref:uncharacterized protein LOC109243102 n=1 Tax=Nicotiana attenuata TaxID=49451 RepID=UPI0009056EEB|nr:PREDICTED: uncharacterized protein LOC109243102 [Nicotiana attenuata]